MRGSSKKNQPLPNLRKEWCIQVLNNPNRRNEMLVSFKTLTELAERTKIGLMKKKAQGTGRKAQGRYLMLFLSVLE